MITAPQLADTTSTSQERFLKVAEVRLKPTGCWHWKNWGFTLVHYLCLKKHWYKTLPLAWSGSHTTGCTESPFCVPLESFGESEEKSKQINPDAVFMLEKQLLGLEEVFGASFIFGILIHWPIFYLFSYSLINYRGTFVGFNYSNWFQNLYPYWAVFCW